MNLREQFEEWYEVHGNGSSYYPQKAAYEAGHAAAHAEAEALLREIVQNPRALSLPRDYSPATEDLRNRIDAYLGGGTNG